jgi:hypothetical protein
MKKWDKELAQLAEEFDRAIVKGKKHYKLVKPGHQPVFAPSTPSDYRTLKNIRRDLKRYQNPEEGKR